MILFYMVLTINMFFLLIAFFNLLFAPRLKREKPAGGDVPKVSVLIPARNEAENIGNLLEDLCNQEYPILEILVYDDQSDDETREVVASYQQKDSRILLLEGDALQPGWSGKQYGCHQLAEKARGDYFLFLDADVRITPSLVESVICNMKRYDLELLSAFPSQIMETEGERIVVPIMMIVLLTLLPLSLVSENNHSSLAAANGQMMCFDSSCYKLHNFHQIFKASRVEDISIIRYMKEREMRVACYLGGDLLFCRMYKGYRESIAGFSKNLIHFFGGSYAIGLLYWILFFLSPLVPLFQGKVFLFFVLLISQIVTLSLVAVCCNSRVFPYLIWNPVRCISFLQIWLRSFRRRKSHREVWKGRAV